MQAKNGGVLLAREHARRDDAVDISLARGSSFRSRAATRSGPSWQKKLRVLALCALIALAAGCKVSAEDIDFWKGTVKGPGKIVAVMLADKYPMELRTQAALALVQMDRTDRDGTADLQQALQRMDEPTRTQVIAGMVPGLEQQMNQPDDKAQAGSAPAARQIRAKDAAFLLIPYASPEAKAKLTSDVTGWYVQDFNGRSLAGNYSAEQVVRALGSPAAKELVGGLKAKLPQQALVKMAQLIGQVADTPTRKEAGDRLVLPDHPGADRPDRQEARRVQGQAGRRDEPRQLHQLGRDPGHEVRGRSAGREEAAPGAGFDAQQGRPRDAARGRAPGARRQGRPR
jgi:hypothetical protein